jgi:hypothetical protein
MNRGFREISRFQGQGFNVLRLQGFEVSRNQGFREVSRFRGFKKSSF